MINRNSINFYIVITILLIPLQLIWLPTLFMLIQEQTAFNNIFYSNDLGQSIEKMDYPFKRVRYLKFDKKRMKGVISSFDDKIAVTIDGGKSWVVHDMRKLLKLPRAEYFEHFLQFDSSLSQGELIIDCHRYVLSHDLSRVEKQTFNQHGLMIHPVNDKDKKHIKGLSREFLTGENSELNPRSLCLNQIIEWDGERLLYGGDTSIGQTILWYFDSQLSSWIYYCSSSEVGFGYSTKKAKEGVFCNDEHLNALEDHILGDSESDKDVLSFYERILSNERVIVTKKFREKNPKKIISNENEHLAWFVGDNVLMVSKNNDGDWNTILKEAYFSEIIWSDLFGNAFAVENCRVFSTHDYGRIWEKELEVEGCLKVWSPFENTQSIYALSSNRLEEYYFSTDKPLMKSNQRQLLNLNDSIVNYAISHDSSSILVLTNEGQIYFSDDLGVHWQDFNISNLSKEFVLTLMEAADSKSITIDPDDDFEYKEMKCFNHCFIRIATQVFRVSVGRNSIVLSPLKIELPNNDSINFYETTIGEHRATWQATYSGDFFKSSDGGKNWSVKVTAPSQDINVHYNDDMKWLILSSTDERFWVSNDSGDTFSEHYYGELGHLNSFCIDDSNTFLVLVFEYSTIMSFDSGVSWFQSSFNSDSCRISQGILWLDFDTIRFNNQKSDNEATLNKLSAKTNS